MKIINTLDQMNTEGKTSVALGNFDGIHIGHLEIFRAALDAAKEQSLKSLCFTFSNHPFNFILRRNDRDPDAVKLICTEEEKIALIESMGFDILVNIPFDEQIMKMRAHDFFENIIVNKLNAGFVSVGFNYTYGARAEGRAEMLVRECEDAGIEISVHDAVMLDGRVVSSTLIREMISSGDMESVRRYLGRPLSFCGRVEHGNRIGSANGIPTANIAVPPERMLPPNGVYFSHIRIDDKVYESVSNLGTKPTIEDGSIKSIETNVFDFNGQLYGKDVEVILDHFSRAEVKFSSREELFAQIRSDCESAAEYHRRLIDGSFV